MNTSYRSLIAAAAAVAALGATAAQAQTTPMTSTTMPSAQRDPNGPVSREEVRAELRAMQAAGLWQPMTEVSPTPLEAAEQERDMAALAVMGDARDGRVRFDRSWRERAREQQMRSPNQDETRSLQNVPNQYVPPAPAPAR